MELPKHLSILKSDKLESMCVNCGLCCYAQVRIDKSVAVLVPELRCKHLMQKSEGETCCSVYENRHDVAGEWCFPLAKAIENGLFPKECPYVADMEGYVGSQVLNSDQYIQIRPHLQKAVSEKGQPEWASDEMWKSFTTKAE